MTYYAVVVDVPAPVAVYDATHAEMLRRTNGTVEGLLVHLCRATDEGFQVLEVWTDRAAYARADREIVAPVLAEVAPIPEGLDVPAPRLEEFAVRGLLIPGTGTVL